MTQFDTAYSRCMSSLNDYYIEGAFTRMETGDKKAWQRMLEFEDELNRLWDGDYDTFRGVLVEYYRFMKGVLKDGCDLLEGRMS